MKFLSKTWMMAFAAASAAGMVHAGPTLSFEGIVPAATPTAYQAVGNSYLAAYGIVFTAGGWAANAENCGGSTNNNFFIEDAALNCPVDNMAAMIVATNDPSGIAGTGQASATATVQGGFLSSLSLRSTGEGEGLLQVFGDVGQLLGSMAVPAVNNDDCGPNAYCMWDSTTLSFTGTAFSFSISGADEAFFVDDVSLGQLNGPPTGTLPSPGGLGLLVAGFGAALVGRRRQHKRGGKR